MRLEKQTEADKRNATQWAPRHTDSTRSAGLSTTHTPTLASQSLPTTEYYGLVEAYMLLRRGLDPSMRSKGGHNPSVFKPSPSSSHVNFTPAKRQAT